MKTMLVIDGDGLLVRSHFAVGKEILTSNNLEVGGVDKFIHVLRRQIRNWNADALYIAFDPEGNTTWRHIQYTDYKSNREERPAGLIHSKNILMPILRAMGAVVDKQDLFEADDLVGSMTHKASAAGWRVVVSSHDKDLLVLLDKKNVIVAPPFQLDPIDSDAVRAKFDIEPKQMIDYLALVSDSADNVPGVPGCGAVKASGLLKKYGTLEEVVHAANRGEVAKKLGESIRLVGKRTLAFRDLMLLREDAQIVEPDSCEIGDPAYNTLLPLLEQNNLMGLYHEAKTDSGVS